MEEEKEVKINYKDWLIHSVDGPFYFTLRVVPQKKIILYLIVTCLLAVAVISFGFGRYYYRLLGGIADVYESHFPPMEIASGSLIVSGEEPIKYNGSEFQVIVDTKHDKVELDELYSQGVLFLKNKMVFIRKGYEPREFPYDSFRLTDFSITSEMIKTSRGIIAFFSAIVWCFLLSIQWLIFKTIAVFVGSIIVGMIAGLYRVALVGQHRIIIAATAMVPAIFIEVVTQFLIQKNFFTMVFPSQGMSLEWLQLLVHGVFLFIGTRGFIMPYKREFESKL